MRTYVIERGYRVSPFFNSFVHKKEEKELEQMFRTESKQRRGLRAKLSAFFGFFEEEFKRAF